MIDRLELELSDQKEKIVLQLDYANKRLEAAIALYELGKTDLAFNTLNKAHQYLLQANRGVLALTDKGKYLTFVVSLDQDFADTYLVLAEQMPDDQRANLEKMLQELKDMENKL
jgi:exonuclease VII small subunit